MKLMDAKKITPIVRTDEVTEKIKACAIGDGWDNLTGADVQTLRLKAKKVGVTLKAETMRVEDNGDKKISIFQVRRVPDAAPRTRTRKPKD